MFIISGFHGDAQVAAVDAGGAGSTLVMDADDVAAAIGNDPGNVFQLAGLINKFNEQVRPAAGLHKASLDDAAETGDIDVTTGDHAHNLLTLDGEFAEHSGCHGNGACALGNHLLLFNESQDGGCNFVFGDGGDIVYILADHIERNAAGLLDGDTVCDGGNRGKCLDFAVPDGVEHTGCTGCLNAVDFDGRPDGLNGVSNTGDQAAAADGNDDRINVIQVIDDFQTNGALTGDDVFVIEGMYEGVPGIFPVVFVLTAVEFLSFYIPPFPYYDSFSPFLYKYQK